VSHVFLNITQQASLEVTLDITTPKMLGYSCDQVTEYTALVSTDFSQSLKGNAGISGLNLNILQPPTSEFLYLLALCNLLPISFDVL
jgi:hypothetical protein